MKKVKGILAGLAIGFLVSSPIKVEAFNGECGVLIEQVTGRVLYEKCADEQKYIASITKIMTAIVAIEEAPLDEYVEISENATLQVGSSLYMKQGDKFKLIDLIYGLMLRSGNDAAMAIAEQVAGSEEAFVELMNKKAKELGLENTVFQNPSGLDETTFNLSTAHDMAKIQQYAMNNPIFREIAGSESHQVTSKNGSTYVWHNKHRLVTGLYEEAIAGKTGFTKKAHRTLVTSAAKDGLELVVVSLNDGDDWNDHMNLFEHGFNNYELTQIVYEGELTLEDPQITDTLYVKEGSYVALKKDGTDTIQTELLLTGDNEETPIHEAGTLKVMLNGEVVDEIDVFKIVEVKPEASSSWFDKVFGWLFGAGKVI